MLPLTGARILRPFLQTKATEFHARFSPDVRWVAYCSDESGRADVFVRPFPGPGPKWQVSSDGGTNPVWSRSGRELFYLESDKLMVVDVETTPTLRLGRPRTLFQGRYYKSLESYAYDVVPDGLRFLMIKADPAESGEAHVNVVTNWFEEVKAKVAPAKR